MTKRNSTPPKQPPNGAQDTDTPQAGQDAGQSTHQPQAPQKAGPMDAFFKKRAPQSTQKPGIGNAETEPHLGAGPPQAPPCTEQPQQGQPASVCEQHPPQPQQVQQPRQIQQQQATRGLEKRQMDESGGPCTDQSEKKLKRLRKNN